ncbi:hypothetical protein MesoLj113a_09540 [Mesorhizobium sp. 113-1-2]|nr:Uncharacterized protein MLTONO_4031 [Mesorhizobium loti]BCG69796.1 hypothetical protein MesoLj113a_09540 [Mesorhizobium sp. 113-1-2]
MKTCESGMSPGGFFSGWTGFSAAEAGRLPSTGSIAAVVPRHAATARAGNTRVIFRKKGFIFRGLSMDG